MKKICLVNGGDFVLGIEAQYILSRQVGGKPAQPATAEESRVFHLGSLLSRRSCDLVPSDSVILHVHKDGKTFFLLVDRIIDDLELPEAPVAGPPACPALAEQLCPQVAICKNLVVLLLDPAQIIPVSEQLGDKVGWVTAKNFFLSPEKPEQNRGKPETEQVVDSVIMRNSKQKFAQRRKKASTSVDEETFKNVMTWTISQFKQGKAGKDVRLGIERLPPDLVRQEGVSDTVIQYLIDQISLRCQESMNRSKPRENHGG
jgi:hypothetical protein